MTPIDQNQGVFPMSVAEELTGLHNQTLRKYERCGFISPIRKNGNRLYSEKDIELLKQIKRMSDEFKLNIAGIKLALAVENKGIKIDKVM